MKAVILVGGFGSRLRPLTLDTPKQMISVVGMTMLERVLDHLGRNGVDEAILALGYLPDVFQVAFPEGFARGVRLTYSVETSPLDTAGAIRLAMENGGIDSTFLVVNGDVLSTFDLTDLVAFHTDNGSQATIALTPVENPSLFGVVVTDETGRVKSFIEKPPRESAPTNLINAGTYVLEPSAIEYINVGDAVSIERLVFPDLAARGELYAKEMSGYWIDAGTPPSLLKVASDIMSGHLTHGMAVHHVTEDGHILLADMNSITGELMGKCYVGRDVEILGEAKIRDSILEDGVKIGNGSSIYDSIILPGAAVGEDCLIDASIIGHGAIVPSGSIIVGGSVVSRHADLIPGSRVEGEKVPG